MASKASKKSIARNIIETATGGGDPTGIVKGVGKSLVEDMALKGPKQFFDFLGLSTASSDQENPDKKSADRSQSSHRQSEVEIFSYKKKSIETRSAKPKAHIEAGIDYHRDIVRSSERASRQELQARQSQIQQLRLEIQSLASSVKTLDLKFSQVTTEQAVPNVGIYQENFLEWMIKEIRKAREEVDNSSACMNIAKNKQSKKGYWNMFKKHGTSFAMSNERGVATQVG